MDKHENIIGFYFVGNFLVSDFDLYAGAVGKTNDENEILVVRKNISLCRKRALPIQKKNIKFEQFTFSTDLKYSSDLSSW